MDLEPGKRERIVDRHGRIGKAFLGIASGQREADGVTETAAGPAVQAGARARTRR